MRARLAAIAALMIITPLFAEVGSGNVAPARLFEPVVWLFLLLTYGIPVLVIRECAVRRRLGISALLLLGFAYGIYNEGILAHTLLLDDHLPLAPFDHGLIWAGINIPWAIFICMWHAIFSVFCPFILVQGLFPQQAGTPWLGTRTTIILAVVALVLVPRVIRPLPLPVHALFVVAILALGAGAFLVGGALPTFIAPPMRTPTAALPLLAGMSMYLPVLLLIVLAAIHPPLALFVLASAGYATFSLAIGTRFWLSATPALARFAVGGYLGLLLFTAVGGIAQRAPDRAIADGALGLLLIALLRALTPRALPEARGLP